MLGRAIRLLFSDEKRLDFYCDFRSISGTAQTIVRDLERFDENREFMKYLFARPMLVPLASIVGTDHPDYCDLYGKNEDGTFHTSSPHFPGKRGHPGPGVAHGWFPSNLRSPSHDVISLSRHPSVDKFFVSGDGNHRVMASKREPNGPKYVFANVSFYRWNDDICFMLYLLSLGFHQYDFEISTTRNGGFFDEVFFSIRETETSRKISSTLTLWKSGSLDHKNLSSLLFAARGEVVSALINSFKASTALPSFDAWKLATSLFELRSDHSYI